ncbi:MAG: PEP-CTERM sorting domain-containing protein [Planctomycetota bacterium]|jgi:hypothetical protein
MNKLASLTLVVVLTSFANAATVSLELDGGGTTVTAGSTVTINVTADWDVSDNAVFNLKQSTTSAAGNATAVAVGTLNAGFDSATTDPGFPVNTQSDTRFILIDRINGVIEGGSPAITAGVPLYSFDLLIPAGAVLNDTFTIDDAFGTPVVTGGPPYDTGIHGGGDVSDIGALTLTVVPEPTSIALLGLGCIFLVRRR